MRILTLTLNPAYDIHCDTAHFAPYRENLAYITSSDAGGKGINISNALTTNNVPNTAYVIVGDENKDAFLRGLAQRNIAYKAISVKGRIRENITLHTENQPETRISFPGFLVDEETVRHFWELLDKEPMKGTYITLTGRLPEGMEIEDVKSRLLGLKERGAKIILDSRSFNKADVLEVKPWLIKPNEEEIAAYSESRVNTLKEAGEVAKNLRAKGIENVLISLGGRGAALCCEAGVFYREAPEIEVVSTVGAGDSAIAGFLGAIAEGKSYEAALRYAVAYGSAACLQAGTAAPDPEAIADLLIRMNG